MHVRVAPSHGEPRLSRPRRARFHRRRSILLVASTLCWCAAACHRPPEARGLTFDWTLTPSPVTVGPAVLELRVLDGAGHRVPGAALQIDAQMSHPGMAPLPATVTDRGDGVYQASFQFTMAGDWILLVGGTLKTGEVVHYRIDVPNVRPA